MLLKFGQGFGFIHDRILELLDFLSQRRRDCTLPVGSPFVKLSMSPMNYRQWRQLQEVLSVHADASEFRTPTLENKRTRLMRREPGQQSWA
jgi:hypothetical protein